ncbi:MAG: hypothetical protein DRG78_01400 [Epsilonproteobacteria bacterium]|nr:MAG: hypothetical protein DRG78_01400 [Campylobacterota bacterium]
MSIKQIKINNLSSFINFEFDIRNKNDSTNKSVVIFGTNGSGKSSLVNMLQLIDKYKNEQNEVNKNILQDFLSNRISKESTDGKISIEIDFNNLSTQVFYENSTKNITLDNNWKKLKIFNEDYTDATIGTSIDINLNESGLIIGEPNKELDQERKKQKSLMSEKTKLEKVIDDNIKDIKDNYIALTNSKSKENLNKISKEVFLKSECIYDRDDSLIDKRNILGQKKAEQQSSIIDIKKLNNFFDLKYFESLFQEEIKRPELTEDYKSLLIKYSNFYEKGMNVEDDSLVDKCPYCLQDWDEKNKIFSDFQNYLESEYSKKKNDINTLLQKLIDFEEFIKNKNQEIVLQEKIVKEECRKHEINSSNYKSIEFDKTQVNQIVEQLNNKINNMEDKISIIGLLTKLQSDYSNLLEIAIKPLSDIGIAIDNRNTKVRKLNTQLSEHFIKTLWEEKQDARDSFNKLNIHIEECNTRIEELEEKDEDINTIQEVFNGLLKFIGLEEYFLDSNNKLQLKIDANYDISNEGNRISTAQRKILSLCYFYAELISNVTNEDELKEYTLIYDDPLDSADYIFFHSITSLIENIEKVLSKILKRESIKIGQHIVFTHNSLLFNRLTQNFSFQRKMNKINQHTQLLKADKIENNYKLYLEIITDFYKKEESSPKEKISIGNIIRRVLEIIISFNKLNSNTASSIQDYGKPTLGLIANHLSHDSFSKVLNPLPTDDEMKIACKELFEVIEENHPKQWAYIEENLLT